MEKNQRIKRVSSTSDRSHPTVRKTTTTVEDREQRRKKVHKTTVWQRTSGERHRRKRTEEPTEQRMEQRQRSVRRTKKKRRRKRNILGRLLQIGLVVALALVLFYVVTNFGEANKLNNKGMEAYEQADYETAVTYFAQAIGRDDSNSEYYMNQGMAQSELKMYDAATTSFDLALEHADRDSEIQLINRARGISLLYQGKYTEALEAFNLALDGKESRFSNTEIDILYYKAETQDKAGLYVDAVMTYTQLVDATNSADAYMLRGMAYVKVGDNTSAESDLRTAIKKDKRNYEIYMSLYYALRAQNKTQEAKAILEEALELGGNKGSALVSQGQIHMMLGDFVSAEEKLKKALDKGEISANLGLAELYMTKPEKDYATAVQYFETYLATVTDDTVAYNKYGLCLMEMENYEKAEEIFTKGVALNDRLTDRTISKNQITAAEHAGHWENALEYINAYLQKYSDDTTAIKEKEFILTRIR